MPAKKDAESVINTIRITSTIFLVVGFLAVIAGLIISINNSALVFDFYTQTTEAVRNAAQENSTVAVASGAIEANRIIANGLYASGIGSLLFGIGLAVVDLLKVGLKK